jgi:hypothetical protein
MSARDVLIRELDEQQGLNVPETRADAILSALAAASYAVVPTEPTEAMILAAPGRDQQGEEESMYHGIYRAMLAALEP